MMPVCSAECEKSIRDLVRSSDKTLWLVVALFMMLFLGGIFLINYRFEEYNGSFGIMVLFAGIGALIIAFPYVTMQTIEMLGARRAIILVRILGVLNIIVGIVLFFYLNSIR